ncbi:MAG: hypothetical protein M3115_07955, partial [Thermoproteota archaeon]|nr:hypothetical protein [Thermoproteota archaeon]
RERSNMLVFLSHELEALATLCHLAIVLHRFQARVLQMQYDSDGHHYYIVIAALRFIHIVWTFMFQRCDPD